MTNRWSELFESGTTNSWGASASRVTFGSSVIDDLAAGLVAHSQSVRRPVVVGCVYVFTSSVIAEALCKQESSCIVVDKGNTEWRGQTYRAIATLNDRGQPLTSSYLPAFDLVSRRVDGKPAILGPQDFPLEDLELGPVRVAGYYGQDRPPLLHAKVAVCCEAWIGEDGFGYEQRGLRALRAWVGSANWTDKSREHREIGVWIDDREFAGHTLDFVAGVVLTSEPLGSHSTRPTPELGEGDLDDDAFADYAAEFRLLDNADEMDDLEEES